MPSMRSLDRTLSEGPADAERIMREAQLAQGIDPNEPSTAGTQAAEPVPEAVLNPSMLDAAAVARLSKSPEGQRLVAWVMSQHGKLRSARKPYERQWYTNQAFYAGRQYVEWNEQQQKLSPKVQTDRHMPRIVINKIRPIIRTEMAKLLSQKPTASVMPASNDDEDVFAARAGEQVWEGLYHRLNFHAVLKRATYWLAICGTTFIKTYWDETVFDQGSGVYGDVQWASLSPFNILVPDLTEEDLQAQGFVLCIYEKPIEWINNAYADVLGGDLIAGDNAEEVASNSQLGILGGQDSKPDTALLIEAWIKPGATTLLPQGGFVTIVNRRIIQAGLSGIPYPHGEFPFAKIDHIPTGRFYGESTITDLIPLQIEYNRTQSQIIEAKNKTTKPQTLYDEGSVDVDRISTEPGIWIPVRPNAQRPSAMEAKDLPAYVIQFNERMQANFEDISGQHEVSRGEAPGSVTSATGIAYLQERDDSYISHTINSVELGVQTAARQALSLCATYWQVPRLVKATGEDGGYEANLMKAADIARGLDLRIEAGSALPMSKSAKLATVMDFMGNAYVTPQEGFELLEMPMLDQWTRRRGADKLAAQRENIDFKRLQQTDVMAAELTYAMDTQESPDPMNPMGPMLPAKIQPDPVTGELPPRGSVIPINEWDNDVVHIEIHELQQKSSSWKNQPQHVQDEMATHVASHKARLMAKMTGLIPDPAPQPGGAYEPGQGGNAAPAGAMPPPGMPGAPGVTSGDGPADAPMMQE